MSEKNNPNDVIIQTLDVQTSVFARRGEYNKNILLVALWDVLDPVFLDFDQY